MAEVYPDMTRYLMLVYAKSGSFIKPKIDLLATEERFVTTVTTGGSVKFCQWYKFYNLAHFNPK